MISIKTYQKNKIAKIPLKKMSKVNILKIKRRLYVSRILRYWIVQRHHNDLEQGYLGIAKTVELLSQNYYFSGIKKKVER